MSCTLGEVKNRADLIIYWGGNPAECHPRHFTKYTLTQKGKFVPNGRKGRTMVLVDIRETPSAKAADIFLQVKPARISRSSPSCGPWSRASRSTRSGGGDRPLARATAGPGGADEEGASSACMFFGMGLSMTRGKHMNSAAVLTLAAEMNTFTKFVAMPMRGHGNVTGGDVIMRWTTGYPFGVNLCRGYPRFNPGEYTTIDLLASRRHRRGPDPGRRPGRDDAATGDRASGPHPDDRARPEGNAHEPNLAGTHHDGSDGHQRAGHRVPHG